MVLIYNTKYMIYSIDDIMEPLQKLLQQTQRKVNTKELVFANLHLFTIPQYVQTVGGSHMYNMCMFVVKLLI